MCCYSPTALNLTLVITFESRGQVRIIPEWGRAIGAQAVGAQAVGTRANWLILLLACFVLKVMWAAVDLHVLRPLFRYIDLLFGSYVDTTVRAA